MEWNTLFIVAIADRALEWEIKMPQQSSAHDYLTWAKQRIDEMDAVLASFEDRMVHLKEDAKIKADQLVTDLTKRRDEFQAVVKKDAEAGEIAWEQTKARLDAQWTAFEAQVDTYFDTIGQQVEQQQATFRDAAAAQAKAWGEMAEQMRAQAAKIAAEKRIEIDAAVTQMKADAAEAEGRLQKLKEAGSQSWSALSAALTESRKAFDRANQVAWDAIKRSQSPDAAA